jgi:ATP-dependent Clp protease protease subunit
MNIITSLHPLLETAKLRHDPVIIRVNKFEEEATTKFIKSMSDAQSTGQPIIPIVIDSYGGYVDSLIAMADCVRASPVPVAMIVEGKAMSCGAMLLSFGTPGLRFISPNSRVMVHEVASGTWGKVNDMRYNVAETARLNAWAFEQLDRNCGKPAGYFAGIVHEKGHADWFMNADEAISHGLAEHKRVPVFQTTIHVKHELK